MSDAHDVQVDEDQAITESAGAGMTSAYSVSRYWRMFFWAAAVFNLIIGLAGMLSPEATIDARIIGLFIFSFGIVYFHVAREPMRFGPILWAGILSKIGILALLAPQVFGAQTVDPMVAGGLVADGIFAVGFLGFLMSVIDDYEI